MTNSQEQQVNVMSRVGSAPAVRIPRVVPDTPQLKSFTEAMLGSKCVTFDAVTSRLHTCRRCDKRRVSSGGVEWCAISGYKVSQKDGERDCLAIYEENLPRWGCKHPLRSEGKGWPLPVVAKITAEPRAGVPDLRSTSSSFSAPTGSPQLNVAVTLPVRPPVGCESKLGKAEDRLLTASAMSSLVFTSSNKRGRGLGRRSHSDEIYVYGFPGLYGGAGTELHHQIAVWLKMKLKVHIIPSNGGYKNEPLYQEMLALGVTVHGANTFSVIRKDAPVMGFCNADFLQNLPAIAKYTRNTVFINCMAWLFTKEKQRMKEGLIRMFLYQNGDVLAKNKPILQSFNSNADVKFVEFVPHFDTTAFPFIEERDPRYFGVGRISRQDADKFARNTLQIWEYVVSPREKRGYMLGFDTRSEGKIGKPFWWITTYANQSRCSQQEFYRKCDIILQPMDTTENWPRIGFEAMSSGSVLIVDNRGGWKQLVKHGVTGWLCDTEQDFIYYASKMAYEPELRAKMARNAQQWGKQIGSLKSSMKSWSNVLEALA